MNKKDRKRIAELLGAITHDCTITVVRTGGELLDSHPKILDDMPEDVKQWWEPMIRKTTV